MVQPTSPTYAMSPPAYGSGFANETGLETHWDTICDAARVIARFGAIPDAFVAEVVERTPDFAATSTGTLRQLAGWAIADIAASLQPGLRALSEMADAGRDTTRAARTLWMELSRAHGEVVTLCESAHKMTPVPADH